MFSRTLLFDVSRGDYVFINTGRGVTIPNHGLLVVGWGDPLNCREAVTISFSLAELQSNASSTLDLVPYVADNTGVQQPVPRPFYCTGWDQFNNVELDFTEHAWFFFTMPNSISIAPDQLYVDPAWQWEATNG